MSQMSNHDLLIRTASGLIRRKGYAGVGLAEILTEAGLPKGSLYSHFPRGKPQLAAAATLWFGDMVRARIDECFGSADGFAHGARRLCLEIAELALHKGRVSACPVMSILAATTEEPLLQDAARQVHRAWTDCAAGHAVRFGVPDADAVALDLHIRLQGAWVLAYAEQSAMPLQFLADHYRAER